ncbi:Digalactosyldiacylglycerol synthase 1 chloroplastic [Zea mays]|uniref:Digalactosyldiacylglycerol synthase 1 chloroplastic n=1 Tax=Zea mays TaxID=4577 RepID=A0A1D6J783_MAIZE|nr:Digalactosyldiacylglycerol synthase 1 chloroplastic [Zea mays]
MAPPLVPAAVPANAVGLRVQRGADRALFPLACGPLRGGGGGGRRRPTAQGERIEKCQYLESSGCVGMCVNMCKVPTQDFFTNEFGLPLTMNPNFEDMSCEMIYGQVPPLLEEDPASKQACYPSHCSMSTPSASACPKLHTSLNVNYLAKGYRELIDLMAKHKSDLEGFKLDVYGSGEDSQEVQSTARRYKVFKNLSISDVLCTTTAEALAMGKFMICVEHPSNEFFMSFPNCLTYKTSEEFVARVKEAMDREPQPLTPKQRYNLSWEATTERFMEYSDLDKVLNNEAAQPKQVAAAVVPQPSSCRTRRVRQWTSTSPGSGMFVVLV